LSPWACFYPLRRVSGLLVIAMLAHGLLDVSTLVCALTLCTPQAPHRAQLSLVVSCDNAASRGHPGRRSPEAPSLPGNPRNGRGRLPLLLRPGIRPSLLPA